MVTCSRCGEVGHNRRSAACPGLQLQQPLQHPLQHMQPQPMEAHLMQAILQHQHLQQHQQQQQQQQQPIQGTIYNFSYMMDTDLEINADVYDRVLIHNNHFAREFIYTDEQPQQQQPQQQDTDVFLIRITNPLLNKSLIVNVGGPHREYNMDGIYAPTWILEALNIHHVGEITWEKVQQPPPRATKLTLRPLDPMFNNIDSRTEIEEHLKNFNVLHEGTTIPILLRPFDNYIGQVFVEKIEPSSICMLRDEVELELIQEEEEADIIVPVVRPPTPIPIGPPLLYNMLEDVAAVQIQQQPQPQPQPQPIQPDIITRRALMAAAAERRSLIQQTSSNL